MSPEPDLLSALAEESRLRAFAAVLLGATATAEVASRAALPERDALRALTTLQAAGLVEHGAGGWVARPERLREAAMAAAEPRTSVDHGAADDRVSAVLRTFMPHGRIETMPAVRSKRLVVLDHVARVFEPGVRYPEPDVNAMLGAFFDDYAALRRYLVDEGFLARAEGSYWRAGGSVDL
ncbi:MAG TPA: DUF2087 domain-containing protein [Actinomycetes bacterium]|nr:DUF2087 domain-containing protein [Actinomycetes bacterium]